MDDQNLDTTSSADEEVTVDRIAEYFDLKGVLKTLREDLKELKDNHEDYDEMQELQKRVKEIREKVKNEEDIRIIQEKMDDTKERMELIKEIIKNQLLESEEEEIVRDGKKLKLVKVLKEMKENES